MSTVVVVPARRGSKGIPQKNLQKINGVTLVGSAIAKAKSVSADRVIVSTDEPAIRDLALDAGAEVPFLRPDALGADTVSLIEVLQHALQRLEEERYPVSVLCSLQPTAPFLSPGSIQRCLDALTISENQSAVTVRRILHNHPYRAYVRSESGELRPLLSEGERSLQRQDLPPMFALSGGFYARRVDLLRRWSGRDFALGTRSIGVEVTEIEGLNIDTPLDLAVARALADSASFEGKTNVS